MIIWITGMSGAGKTFLASEVMRIAREAGVRGALSVDGDVIREVWGGDLGYSEEDRRKNMARIARLCRYINDEGAHAVAAVVAPFQETRDWCRANISSYYEVFVKTPLEHLTARDPKGHYRRALAGETGLPGVNQLYETPASPDLIIENSQSKEAFLAHAAALADLLINADAAKPGTSA